MERLSFYLLTEIQVKIWDTTIHLLECQKQTSTFQ